MKEGGDEWRKEGWVEEGGGGWRREGMSGGGRG